MDDEIANAHAAIFTTALRMRQIFIYLATTADEIPMPAQLFIGAALVSIAKYCKILSDIITDPTIEQPVMGRRCMFY